MSSIADPIHERYLQVMDRIASATRSAGREPDTVRLVVVTKAQPLNIVRSVIEAGASIVGENYPEEAVEKVQALGSQTAVEWHMIGHVQSRKASIVAEHFALVHSLDSLKLAQRLDRFAAELGRTLPVLLEFNVGEEATKSGWMAAREDRCEELLPALTSLLALPHLQVRGLMVMPPLGEAAEASRPYFQRTRRLQEWLGGQLQADHWRELSMGTSLDYEVAVQEGATLVRVGTAITGPRQYSKES
ncbi:MAG TPA: YggS family pyridoxal phosphate-dependent enzyme [Anaerolineales bacterium]